MRLTIRGKIAMDKLNTPGGHIVVSMILIFSGMGAAAMNIAHGSELTVFGLGVLSRSMLDGQTPTSITTRTPTTTTTATTGETKP